MNPLLFVESARFARWVKKSNLRAAVGELYAELAVNPEAGPVIQNGGGLRKVRMAGLGRGKSGGFRVVYVLVLRQAVALVVDGYSKSVKEDVTADELADLRKLVAELTPQAEQMLRAEMARRSQQDQQTPEG
jgi:hypothetical protein